MEKPIATKVLPTAPKTLSAQSAESQGLVSKTVSKPETVGLQVKITGDGKVPTKATDGSNAYDIYGKYEVNITPGEAKVFDTGIKVEVPTGYCMLVLSRSGHGFNKGLRLANCVGLIDSDYRGEVKVKLHNDSKATYKIEAGERIAQALFLKTEEVSFLPVDALTATERGEQGIGSTNTTIGSICPEASN